MKALKNLILIFLALLFLSLTGGCGRDTGQQGQVIVRAGWPATVSLVGYDKKTASPLYQIILPGVYQMRDKIIIKGVQPGQTEAVLNIGVNERGALSYSQCLKLLEHLKSAYDFEYAFYKDAAVKKLQAGEKISVPEFSAMLQAGKVPPLSPLKVAEMEAALDLENSKGRSIMEQ